jgi:AcrR family transcriptional regulator
LRLYQYFATREEIVAAIVERDRSIAMAELESLLSERDSAEKDPREIVAEFVRLFVKAFGGEDGAPRAFVRLAWQDSSGDAFLHSLREAGERLAIYLHHFRHPALRTQTPALVFVLTRALSGVVRAAVLERTPLIDTEDLQKEMARICWALLAKRR